MLYHDAGRKASLRARPSCNFWRFFGLSLTGVIGASLLEFRIERCNCDRPRQGDAMHRNKLLLSACQYALGVSVAILPSTPLAQTRRPGVVDGPPPASLVTPPSFDLQKAVGSGLNVTCDIDRIGTTVRTCENAIAEAQRRQGEWRGAYADRKPGLGEREYLSLRLRLNEKRNAYYLTLAQIKGRKSNYSVIPSP